MHEKRKKAIDSLKRMMQYPGRFSVLVLGDNGVGKTHWISENIRKIKRGSIQENSFFIDAGLAEDSKEFWTDIFTKANHRYLVIEEVEKLSSKSQEIIFNILSTYNGKYGLEEKNLEINIIFTSCFPIAKLRQDRRFLSAKFFDRISQFVVTFPNFIETQREIYQDFKETWEKFFDESHKYHDRYPKSDAFKEWLHLLPKNMHGNFRDLDKIVINWNFHQVSTEEITEAEILELVKKDFNDILKYPAQRVYDDNSFVFIEDVKYDEMMTNFRKALRNWSLGVNYNNIHNAADMLGVSHRTMERWR
ncbi:MAG: hypothetical protein ACQETL_19155 [Bacteroidota bacterium]